MSDYFQQLYDALIPDLVYDTYEDILKGFGHQDIIIDVGCGTGRLTRRLRHHANKVYAFDIDSKMIDIASKDVEGITYLIHDMHKPWPFYGSLICMSQDVLNFTKKPLVVLDHAMDALQGSGVIIFDVYQSIDKYEEKGTDPFEYYWKRTVRLKTINHVIKVNGEVIRMKQIIHNIERIKKYLKNKGFEVKIIPFINEEKVILIAKR